MEEAHSAEAEAFHRTMGRNGGKNGLPVRARGNGQMGAKMKPVYMINGFLESGKTEFISFTLAQNYFQIKGKTLLILCEEGENEYDPALLKKKPHSSGAD